VIVVLAAQVCSAQTKFSKLKTIVTRDRIQTAAIDRVGELYLIYENYHLEKVGIEGEIIASEKLQGIPTLFDPRDGSHLFLYWKDDQQYELRFPDLTTHSLWKVDSAFAVNPFLVCPSGDHDLIVLDSADWSLKKVSTKSGTVLYETIIFENNDDAHDITFMREYQNFVFILDKAKGLFIYNRMGKLLKSFPGKSITFFNFLGEEMYFPENGGLKFFDLFTAEERFLTLPSSSRYAFLTDERLYLVNDRAIDLYSLVK
jgi:hypothetical protein